MKEKKGNENEFVSGCEARIDRDESIILDRSRRLAQRATWMEKQHK